VSKTVGISPKVFIPALGQIIVGIILLILGFTVEGKTLIASGLGTFAVGFKAPPAPVVTVSTESPTGDGEPVNAGQGVMSGPPQVG
jgi:hypothetical protein